MRGKGGAGAELLQMVTPAVLKAFVATNPQLDGLGHTSMARLLMKQNAAPHGVDPDGNERTLLIRTRLLDTHGVSGQAMERDTLGQPVEPTNENKAAPLPDRTAPTKFSRGGCLKAWNDAAADTERNFFTVARSILGIARKIGDTTRTHINFDMTLTNLSLVVSKTVDDKDVVKKSSGGNNTTRGPNLCS